MSELCAYDIDGTIRDGCLVGDAILHGIKEGFMDKDLFGNPANPTRDEIGHFVESITTRSRTDFRELTDWLSDEARQQTMDWAIERLEDQRGQGSHRILVSHSPDFLVKAFGRGLGVHHAVGSYFHTKEHVFSGRAKTADKSRALTNYLRRQSLGNVAFAAGDSEYDLPMLERAQHGVVVNPDARLGELALQNDWEIIRTIEETRQS